jgi:HK97 family phage prohead protease
MKKLDKKHRPGQMKTLDCHVEWDLSKMKSAGGKITIEGYANTVDKDRVGDVVLPTAFEKSLPVYLDNPVMLFQHDWDKVIGRVTEAKVTDKGLWVKGEVSNAKDVEDVRTKIAEGSLKTFSIGYNEVDAVYDESRKINIVKELELLEISVVTIPANAAAKFSVVGEQKTETEEVSKGLLDPDFFSFVSEQIAELDDSEEISSQFLKELFDMYVSEKGQKSYKPQNGKKFSIEELQFHHNALQQTAPLIAQAHEKLAVAIGEFTEAPDTQKLMPLQDAMWDISRNVYEAQNHAMAIDAAKFEGLVLPKPAPVETETAEDGEKSLKIKGLSESEAAHLERTLDSAWKMAGSCMKELAAAHNACAKDCSESTMKSLDENFETYSRAMAEVKRCMDAMKAAKETPKDGEGGEAADDKPEGEKND